MVEPSHFESGSQGLATIIRPLARDLYWLRGFEDYWPDDRSQQFFDELTGLADAASGPVVLDLSRVLGLNRDGIALIVRMHKRLADRGNVLAVAASPALLTIFEITGLNRLFSCAPRLEAAVEGFGMSPETGDGAGRGDGDAGKGAEANDRSDKPTDSVGGDEG